MKRLNGLISVIAILSITACSSDPINTVSPTPENNTQTVSAQSVKGLTSFYNTIVDRTFNLLDKTNFLDESYRFISILASEPEIFPRLIKYVVLLVNT